MTHNTEWLDEKKTRIISVLLQDLLHDTSELVPAIIVYNTLVTLL